MIPFCQLLVSNGYTLLYVSPHGMLEEGKDIIALNQKGEPEAFQLKNGDITLAQWRSIQGEINELVALPIQHASVSEKSQFKSWLVTNGEVKDPVRTQIVTQNRNNWGQKKNKKLQYQDKGVLLAGFLKAYGHFFPAEPADYKLFLDLHLTDGAEMFPKEKYLKFIESHLQVSATTLTPTQAQSLIASSIIMTSYILKPWEEKQNHVAQIEAWTCLMATIFAIATKFSLTPDRYQSSLEIIQIALEDSFANLLEEVKKRPHLIEGDWRTDTVVYPLRTTIILGYLCAYGLYKRLQGKPLDQNLEKDILAICEKHESKMRFIGETFSPLFVVYFWFNELHQRSQVGNRISTIVLGLINESTYPTPFGWPNPYYDYEYALRLQAGFLWEEHTDSFAGASYSLQALLGIITRRDGRDFVAAQWRKITHTQFAEFVPGSSWETFLWRSPTGTCQTRFPTQTQSWKTLKEESLSTQFTKIPDLFMQHSELLLIFILVYPQRLTEENIRFLDLTLSPKMLPSAEVTPWCLSDVCKISEELDTMDTIKKSSAQDLLEADKIV